MERPSIPEAGAVAQPTASEYALIPPLPCVVIKVEPVQARVVGGGTSAVVSGVLSGAQLPEGAIIVAPDSASTGC